MNELVIESSSPEGSVAVLCGGVVTGAWTFHSPRGRGGAMFPALEKAVAVGGPPDRVVVGTGPGGYNGLRMAMAAGWGIARAHGAPLLGVCSLLGYDAPEYFVVGDARGGRCFFSRVARGAFVREPTLVAPAEIRSQLVSGLPVFVCGAEIAALPEALPLAPRAEILARHSASFGPPKPIYLKPPHITTPKAVRP